MTMNRELDTSGEEFGLAAYGSSGRWAVAVHESLARDEWSVEIEGPQTYLDFQLRDLAVVSEALRFLRAGPRGGRHGKATEDDALVLGRFNSASVSLVWDDE